MQHEQTNLQTQDFGAVLPAIHPALDSRPRSNSELSDATESLPGYLRRPRLLRPLAWRILVTILVLLALTLIGLAAGSTLQARPAAFGASSPLVLAFYYSWFDENTWTYDQLSDLPSEPYVSRDRGVMGRHIDQAKAAGIDALVLAWYGPAGGTNQTEPNLSAMLDEAAARGFRVSILFETDGPFFNGVGDVTAALQHARNTHFNHPAYLRVDGRPVVFFWRPTIYGVDTWRNIRAQSDPDYNSIWIAEGVNTAYLNVFDGHHLYSNTWNPPADLHAVNRKFADQVAGARDRLGAHKFWVATVMPGYDDVRIRRGAGGFAQDRQGGAYYTRSWDAAISSNPNWIVINSFNEWPEGSYIESSAAHGDLYMQLTAQHSAQFRSGGGVPVALAPPVPPVPAEPTPVPTPTPEPDSPTAFVNVAMLNLRGGPSTEFPVLNQMRQGAALPITGRHPSAEAWWQVEIEGQTGWVHADFVRSGGPLAQVVTLDDAALPVLSVPQPALEGPSAAEAPTERAAGMADSVTESLTESLAESLSDEVVGDLGAIAAGLNASPPPVENPNEVTALVLASADEDSGSQESFVQAADPIVSAGVIAATDMAHPLPDRNQVTLHPVLSR